MIYRRLWLLLLIVVFAVTAPAVVFYTAGYRWNPKKWTVERNGTLIFDTEPSGASIFLNDERLDGRTPLTRTDIAPGTYRVRLERDGYYAWEKTIEVRPERATFVTDIWLWNRAEPVRVVEGTMRGLAASPDGRRLALIEETVQGPQLVIRRLSDTGVLGLFGGGDTEEFRLGFEGASPTGTIQLLWDRAGENVLIEDEAHDWVGNVQSAAASALPEGTYRWDGNTLIGVWDGERLTYIPAEGAVRRTTLEAGIRDRDGNYVIREMPNGNQVVVEDGKEAVQFSLPSGNWTFSGREEGWLLLRERTRKQWLAFDPRNAENVDAVVIPTSAEPQLFRRGRETLFLASNANELWLAALGKPAELLVRSSDAVTAATWHEKGLYVFYSTTRNVAALGLDVHNGRVQTMLGSFDAISQMTVAGTTLFVAGQKEGQSGVWMLNIEP